MSLSIKKIMVIDTETTGFTKPVHIVQLSYIIYDITVMSPTKIFNTYIDLPSDTKIDKRASDVHHITRKTLSRMSSSEKMPIKQAIDELLEDCKTCDIIMGHNIKYDKDRIIDALSELQAKSLRKLNPFSAIFYKYKASRIGKQESLCTMDKYKPYCKMPNKKGTGLKNPTLKELYQKVFGYTPKDLHNSLVDIIVCLRAYIKIEYDHDIYGENDIIDGWIHKIEDISCPTIGCTSTAASRTSSRTSSSSTSSLECTGMCDVFSFLPFFRRTSSKTRKHHKSI